MPPKKDETKRREDPGTTSGQDPSPASRPQNVNRPRPGPISYAQSVVPSRSTQQPQQQPPQRSGNEHESRPSTTTNQVPPMAWARVVARAPAGPSNRPGNIQVPSQAGAKPAIKGSVFGVPKNSPLPDKQQKPTTGSQSRITDQMDNVQTGFSSLHVNDYAASSPSALSGRPISSPGQPPASSATKSSTAVTGSPSVPSNTASKAQQNSTDEVPGQVDSSNGLLSLVKRPQYCDSGSFLTLYANFFKLNVGKPGGVRLTRYSIDIVRQNRNDVDVKGLFRSQCIRLALGEAKFEGYRNSIVTDHKANLYSVIRLPEDLHSTTIQYHTERHVTAEQKAKNYVIELKEGRTLDLSAIVPNMVSQAHTMGQESRHEILMALDIFLGDFAQRRPLSMTYLNNRCYNLDVQLEDNDLSGGLEAVPGFYSSVRPASGSLMVNVNRCTGAFYKKLRLDHLMQEWDEGRDDRGSWHPRNEVKFDALQTFLKGLRIVAEHLSRKEDSKGNPRPWIKRIWGLAQITDGQVDPQNKATKSTHDSDRNTKYSPPPEVDTKGANPRQVRFWHEEKDKWVSVLEYFEEAYPDDSYDWGLSRSQWCVVNVGNKERPIYLPAEACVVLSGQAYKKSLSPDQTTAMIRKAILNPNRNKRAIEQNGLADVGLATSNNAKMNSFGLSLPDSSLMKVRAQILSLPKVRYANDSQPGMSGKHPTMWNMGNMKLETPATIQKWTFVRILEQGSKPDMRQMDVIAEAFRKRLIDHGMTVLKHTSIDNHFVGFSSRRDAPDRPFRDCLDQVLKKDIKFLLIVLPDKNANRYGRIKILCDKEKGVRNVCVLAGTLASRSGKPNPQTLSNLCLKANLKMGGVNFVMPARSLDFIEDNDTMVIGIDVTHPSSTSAEGTPSIAAMVASMDKKLAQWPAVLRVQRGLSRQGAGIEMASANLKLMLVTQLQRWKNLHNGKLPNNILVFRDGISEGQYRESLESELPRLREACRLDPENGITTPSGRPVRMTLIVCAKRHHTRFYQADNNGGGVQNPPGGTYVDRDITESHPWDFYLQSHTALKGTARPAHYIVLHDEIIRQEAAKSRGYRATMPPANLIAQITHNMCYLFGRSTGSVSICPAVYYADLACSRARCFLMGLYNNTERPSPAVLYSEAAMEQWLTGLQSKLDLLRSVENSMFYI